MLQFRSGEWQGIADYVLILILSSRVAVRRSSRKGPERQINTNEAEQQVNVCIYSSASPPLQTCTARLSHTLITGVWGEENVEESTTNDLKVVIDHSGVGRVKPVQSCKVQ